MKKTASIILFSLTFIDAISSLAFDFEIMSKEVFNVINGIMRFSIIPCFVFVLNLHFPSKLGKMLFILVILLSISINYNRYTHNMNSFIPLIILVLTIFVFLLNIFIVRRRK